MDQSLVEKLVELSKSKRLIPFIGAGFSMPLGLPGWGALMEELAKELGWDPKVFMQSVNSNNNYLLLAEYYVLEKAMGDLSYALARTLMIDKHHLANSKSHELLTKLEPPAIYTTNYDDAIEMAFEHYLKPHYVVRNINDMKRAKIDSTLIYKFHGDLRHEDSLVLTESKYFERMEFEDPLDIRLRSDILHNTLLFLGYSFSDINTRYMFYRLSKINQKLKKGTDNCTAIMVTFGISEVQKAILKNWGVETVELDPIDKNKSLVDFLQLLIP